MIRTAFAANWTDLPVMRKVLGQKWQNHNLRIKLSWKIFFHQISVNMLLLDASNQDFNKKVWNFWEESFLCQFENCSFWKLTPIISVYMWFRTPTTNIANESRNEIDVRSTFTIQSYVRIDRFDIDYQSAIDQSNQFIHLSIIQPFKPFILLYRSIQSTKIRNRKTDEIHKSAQSVWCALFILF